MSKALTFKYNVQLSEKFGGIAHGQKPGLIKRGTVMEIKNDELADHLIESGNAEELKVEGAEAPDKKGKKAE